MADLKGALAVNFNIFLMSFSLYTFKTGIAAASEPIPLEKAYTEPRLVPLTTLLQQLCVLF